MGNGGVELGHTPFLAEDSRLTEPDRVVGTLAHAHPFWPTKLRAPRTPRFQKIEVREGPLGPRGREPAFLTPTRSFPEAST
jgi:hypothetical protein